MKITKFFESADLKPPEINSDTVFVDGVYIAEYNSKRNPFSKWGSERELEIHKRIKLSVAAYAYEFCSHSIMSDADYDQLSLQINLDVDTGNKKMDKFFKKQFEPDTGMWIRKHPQLNRIAEIYRKHYAKNT